MDKYRILNVSNWENTGEAKGYSKTYWLINPETRRKALFKFPKYNKDEIYTNNIP